MNWGFYIKALREEAGLTQDELSRKSGLKRSHISNIERGVYKGFSSETITKAARGLGLTEKSVIDRIYGDGHKISVIKTDSEIPEIKVTILIARSEADG